MEIRRCECDKFEKGMKAITDPIALQTIRTGASYEFDLNYMFDYCPWCGNELKLINVETINNDSN